MKRGLKGVHADLVTTDPGGYNPCPDEKGTERYLSNPIAQLSG